MQPKLTLAAFSSAALILAGCSHISGVPPTPEATNPEVMPASPNAMSTTVTYTNNAMSPAELKIKAGTKVMFTNGSTAAMQLNRNPHPAHTGSIEFAWFDSGILDAGKSYDFTFTKKGTLSYHNHFNPGVMGKVVVE